MNQKDHRLITEKEFKKVIKDVLGSKKPGKTLYENRKPTKEELKTKWKLIKR